MIMLLALDAELVLARRDGERRTPLWKLYRGYKQVDLAPATTSRSASRGAARRTLQLREGLEAATSTSRVTPAAWLRLDDGSISEASLCGGVALIPCG
jgi:CO/xanthine dehydrogenase FAD-binding subunit